MFHYIVLSFYFGPDSSLGQFVKISIFIYYFWIKMKSVNTSFK